MQPSGSVTSLIRGLSVQDRLILEVSLTLRPTTSVGSLNATSSPVSEDGASPSATRCSQTIDLFGQDHAPASHSLPPEKAKHQAMNATSGPTGSNLSELADRQSSLANRLKRQLDGVGSTLFTLIWRQKVTPLGRPYYQLQASGLRTKEIGFGSLPTPTARDWQDQARLTVLSRLDLRPSSGGAIAEAARNNSFAGWVGGQSGNCQPMLFTGDDGLSSKVAKLRAAGNAIVPQVAAEFIKASMS
jgi:hypothetical protein